MLIGNTDMTSVERECAQCGAAFRGETKRCPACQERERTCATCGATFTSRYRTCPDCRGISWRCQFPGCENPKAPGRGSKLCQDHRDSANQRKLERLRRTACHIPGCEQPKVRGNGYLYCAEHSAEATKGSDAYKTIARVREGRRKKERSYGVSHDEFLRLLDAQGAVCAICKGGNGKRALSIDHDHATGAVRGLLCDRCNPMLGYARDDVAVLQAAIEYLSR